MRNSTIEEAKPSRATYEVLEEMVWKKVQEYIHDILDDELTEFLGRKKSERIKGRIDVPMVSIVKIK